MQSQTLSESKSSSSSYTVLFAISGAFITYFSMYAFRKPFTAGEYEAMQIWGIDYKILLIITQALGYTLSKFIGIKVVSEMKAKDRIMYILILIGISWAALFLFAIIPYPFNTVCLFLNGVPLGMIWGIVFAFLEGRRQTEFLAAGLSTSFIISSGCVKSIGRLMLLEGISEYWMPFFVGVLFIPGILLGVWLLMQVPPPDRIDQRERTKRVPMTKLDRRKFFRTFAPGIVMITIIYMALNGYKEFRDNFAVEIWNSLGYESQPYILSVSELPIAILVLVVISCMIFLRDHKTAFYSNLCILGLGGVCLIMTTYMASAGMIPLEVWMICVGFGMYLAYISYHTMLFERWIALFRCKGNIGYIMYICDSLGYLASVGVLLYKNFWLDEMSWLNFFINISYFIGGIVLLSSLLTIFYFFCRGKIKIRTRRIPVLESWG